MKNNLILSGIIFLMVVLAQSLYAQQDGALDPAFGTNGIRVITDISNVSSSDLKSVIVQPDGKILLGGYANAGIPQTNRFFISRILSSDGSTDPNFNAGVHKVFSDSSNLFGLNIALKSDGSILFGGGRGPNTYATVGSVSSNGTTIFGPVTPVSTGMAYQHNITSMSYNTTNDRIVLGGYISITSSYMLGYRFKTDGSRDSSFHGNGTINFDLLNPIQNYTSAKSVVNMDDGSILLGGGSVSNNSLIVVKLKPDGSFDTNFGTAVTQPGVAQIGTTSGNVEGLTLLPSGKILVCGIVGNDGAIFRLSADGRIDNSFSAPLVSYTTGSTDKFTSMVVQPDGKILASGYSTFSGGAVGVISRFKLNGNLDSTFGANGTLYVSGILPNASAIVSTAEKTIVLVGKNAVSAGQITVAKLKYEQQKYNILGKDIVSVETENDFIIHPVVTNYTYTWSYSSPNVYTLGSNVNDTVTMYFNKTTPSGVLSCTIKNQFGAVVKVATKYITVNPEPTLAQRLEDVQCDPAQTDCATNYINSFNIRQKKISSSNTGASETGYIDLTASANYDTLYTGDNYQANVECEGTSSGVIYCGVWIDFNNDGKMSEPGEFVGSSASSAKTFTVNNIVIPTETETGPKRLRVRVRQSRAFDADEFCMPNEELSETEDYLLVLGQYDAIKAPNFITPNNDGKNDNFIVRGIKAGVNNSLKIFNRVGDLVYDIDNYDNSWAGIDKSGGALKPGTYYYVFTQPNPDKAKDDVVKGFFEIRY